MPEATSDRDRREAAERERVRSQFFRLTLPKRCDESVVDHHAFFDHCDEHHRAYKRAKAFPHAVIDDFLTPSGFERVHAAVAGLGGHPVWDPRDADDRDPPRLTADLFMAPALRELFGELGTETFCAAMHSLTGIAKLVPDPMRTWDGLLAVGGEGWTARERSPRHPVLPLVRRVQLTIFLCARWDDAWGGAMTLRSKATPGWSESVTPVPNRCVITNTPAHAAVRYEPFEHPAGAPLMIATQAFLTPPPVPGAGRAKVQ